jgi:aspartyl-tRNA(Asn)/glutamyl-tRNA(Gln) amidotransferase subunit A
MTQELCFLSLREAGERLRRRGLSPVELTEAFLDRIESLNPILHAYITVCPERARADALRAEGEIAAGDYRGPLHGIPIGLKDVIATKGIRTTACSRRLLDFVPDADATIVRRLTEAGAVLLGKLTTFEFATGGPSTDLPFPLACNPWHLDAYTGGSSTGSGVAVAAGLAMAAIGTDAGGSVRLPASHCGAVGLKPTFGRISKAGIFPLTQHLDHVGTLTWTVEDAALMLSVSAGPDPADPTAADEPVGDYSTPLRQAGDLKGTRVGLVNAWYERDARAGVDVLALMDSAVDVLRSLGAEVEPVELSPLDDYQSCLLIMILSEAYAIFESDLAKSPELFGQVFRDRITMGAFLRASDYALALRLRQRLIAGMARAFERFDVLVTAGMLTPLWLADIKRHAMYKGRYLTAAWNITGHPAIAVRAGFSSTGLPIGLQIAGRRFDEACLLRVAHRYEQASGWLGYRPQLNHRGSP